MLKRQGFNALRDIDIDSCINFQTWHQSWNMTKGLIMDAVKIGVLCWAGYGS